MILLNVTYKVKSGQREAFYQAVCDAKVPELSRAEAGNIKYDYYLSVDDADTILLIEHWKDAEAFKLHTEEEHFKLLGKIKDEYVAETIIGKYEVEA